jgi:MFS family permease
LFAVFYPLVQGRELGWPAWSIVLLAAAVPLFGGFAWHQRLQFRRGGEPLLPPDLVRPLAGSQAVLLCVNTAVGVFFVLTLHLQLGLGFSPWEAALTFAPSTLGIVAGNVLAMHLAPKLGRSFTAGAVAVLLAGLVVLAVLVSWLGTALRGWALLMPVIAVGLGLGAVLNALFGASMARIRPERAGAASGIVNTTVQLGMATGIALSGTIFFTRLDGGSASATAGALAVSAGVLVLALLLTAALPVRQPSVPQSQAVG